MGKEMVEVSYDECRKQRLQDNKKRMQELNLKGLSTELSVSSSPKPSPAKSLKRKREEALVNVVRRSSRNSNKPAPDYRELSSIEGLQKRRSSSSSRPYLSGPRASEADRCYAIEKAENALRDLDPQYPSIVKAMLHSHVERGFWLGLPVGFCTELPTKDTWITLEDEEGQETKSLYLALKHGLSAGWRGFSVEHGIRDGDAVIFQYMKPESRFKVFIFRAIDAAGEEEE